MSTANFSALEKHSRRWLLLAVLTVQMAACAPSARAMQAYQRGDYCEFCRISYSASNSEPNSMHNLGLCYENGWCGYTQSNNLAVQQYTLGARWGIDESRNALVRLGFQPPFADLKIAQDLRDAQERAAMWGAIAAGLANAASTMNTQPTYNGYQPNQYNAFAPVQNNQGCCSYHGGIHHNFLGAASCHYTGKILCNDFQPSPTCLCN